MPWLSSSRTVFNVCVLASSLTLAACELDDSPTVSVGDPWAGFPPNLTEIPYSQYLAQYRSDIARYKSGPDAFMGSSAPALACSIPADRAKQFALDAYLLRQDNATAMWDNTERTYLQQAPIIAVDQVELRVLEGNCSGGTVNGPATLHARFVHISPHLSDNRDFRITKVELRESCTYTDLKRDGECRIYQTHETQLGILDESGKMHVSEGEPETGQAFSYGHYQAGRESAPGAAFETIQTILGNDSKQAMTRRAASNQRVHYQQYVGGTPYEAFYRRLSDGKLHGQVTHAGYPILCYSNGEQIMTTNCSVE
jgi:hypothetical protein